MVGGSRFGREKAGRVDVALLSTFQPLKYVQQLSQRRSSGQRVKVEFWNVPSVSLVGYTNAGKSTLWSTDWSGCLCKDRLFATLFFFFSVQLPGHFPLMKAERLFLRILLDLFKKLPTNLIGSFKSTLVEAQETDPLIHLLVQLIKSF